MENEKKKPYKKVKRVRDVPNTDKDPQLLLDNASELNDEEKAVINILSRISINARRRAYKRNSPVTIIRNGRILKVHSNRKVKSVGVVKKIKFMVDINKPIKIR